MMRMATKAPGVPPAKEATFFLGAGKAAVPNDRDVEWEMRPGGMLVQRRNADADADAAGGLPAPTVRVRVKYGAAHHEIRLSPQATFGELKKVLAERTGLHPQDQKVVFKGKEREPSAFLDTAGVKDRSKVVLVEDPAARARRFLEMRRAASMEKAARALAQVGLEVDRLATKVAQLGAIVGKGKKVAEGDVVAVIEQLMNQLVKLDGLVADGDVKLQGRMLARRVQKYVETLDVIKIENSMQTSDTQMQPPQRQQQKNQPRQYHHHLQRQEVLQKVHQPPVMVTTNWEAFDLLSGPPPASTTPNFAAAAAAPITRFEWELF